MSGISIDSKIYKILKENNGYLTIEEGQTYTATVVVEDFKGKY